MKLPAPGIYLPCKVSEVRDGDTVVVSVSGDRVWAIRLRDCWCPESRGKGKCEAGIAAKAYAEKLVADGQAKEVEFLVAVPLVGGFNGKPANLIKRFISFDRLIGDVWIGKKRLNDLMVAAGHATRRKEG